MSVPVTTTVLRCYHTVCEAVCMSVATMQISLRRNAVAHLVKARSGCASEGPPLTLTPLHQLTPISHLLHHLLLHEEEVCALHLALLGLLAGVPVANALGMLLCFIIEGEVGDESQIRSYRSTVIVNKHCKMLGQLQGCCSVLNIMATTVDETHASLADCYAASLLEI